MAGNYRRWEADLLLLICDAWTVDPGQLAGLHVMAWMPLDTDKLGIMNRQWLDTLRDTAASVRPVAMSKHGRQLLQAAGWDAPLVPHKVAPDFYPDADAGLAWRESLKIPENAFVITKVGVNDEDDRKSFVTTLLAFSQIAAKNKNAYLYLHTEAQVRKAPNLAVIALDLGLKGRVAFADEYRRGADLYTASEMRSIYNGSTVLDAATKGEGFGVPIIEALACGTPVIGCRNSAVTEKIRPEWGWLIGGQRIWAKHHHAWWTEPGEQFLVRAYESARTSAKSKRAAARAEGARYRDNISQWRKALASPARPADHGKIFRGAYASGKWGHGSGPGSDPAQCKPYIHLVEDLIRFQNIRSVLDLGCGDGQLARAIDWGKAEYEGLDVVTGHDIRTCDLPPADLVVIKDVFQHWPNADIGLMLFRLREYGRILVTNTVSEQITGLPVNADIAAGQWRSVDLATPPFSMKVRELLRWELPHETKSAVLLLEKGD